MWHPSVSGWGAVFTNFTVTGGTSNGAVVTPGFNAYGTPVQLLSGAQVASDTFEVWLNINTLGVSAVARDAAFQFLVDPAGGTNWRVLIPHVPCACANPFSNGAAWAGIWSRWPLIVTAGSSVAVQVSVNASTVGTCSAVVWLSGRPTHGDLVRAGTFVRAFGATPATSSGTPLTPGTAAKGAYVPLLAEATHGGAGLVEPLWCWNGGMGINNAVMSAVGQALDIAVGNATDKRIVVRDQMHTPGSQESLGFVSRGWIAEANVGELVYARAASMGSSPIAGWSAIAHGVGG